MRRECNQIVLWQLNCGCVCQQHGGRIESLNCIAYFFWELCLLPLAGLVSSQRSQALTALTLKDILLSENGTRFCVSSRLKTSPPGKSLTPVIVPKNTSNGRLCPHTTFQTCIRRTESVSVKWYMKYIEVLTFSGFYMQLLKLNSELRWSQLTWVVVVVVVVTVVAVAVVEVVGVEIVVSVVTFKTISTR